MIWLQLAIVLVFIVIGARMKGIGIGLAGGAGVIALAATGMSVDPVKGIPWSVIGIIMPVVCAVSAMQVAGGMDHLVHLTEILLRRHPKQINYLGPLVSFVLTMLCGTGHTVYSVLPVIIEVAKEKHIRPSRPLSMSVIASQVAIVASPISAATVAMVGILEPLGVGYLQVLAVSIPVTVIGCVAGILVASHQGRELDDDPVYQQRKAAGLVAVRLPQESTPEWVVSVVSSPTPAAASLAPQLLELLEPCAADVAATGAALEGRWRNRGVAHACRPGPLDVPAHDQRPVLFRLLMAGPVHRVAHALYLDLRIHPQSFERGSPGQVEQGLAHFSR